MTAATDLVVLKLDKARIALAEAKTIQDTKKVLDVVAAAEIYARRQKLGQEAISYAHDIKIEALSQLGKLMEVQKETVGLQAGARGRPGGGTRGSRKEPQPNAPPTLKDLGLDKKTSALSQKLAALPPEQFEQVKAGTMAVTAAIREVQRAAAKDPPPLTGKYRVLYADPPWLYGNANLQQYGHASHHYRQMSIAELRALDVKSIAENDAVLFLWVTSPMLSECFAVIEAWGFKYKTSFVWDKVLHNFGHYNSVRHEFLLICTRGKCTPDSDKLHDSVQSIERSKTHSEKPEEFRAIIDEMYPRGKRVELFARKEVPGWDRWGNE